FTLRSGRYVLPVKHERRGAVEGIVHDISQTGQSLYIEPREVTGLNNRLRTAELEIEREIYRIRLEMTYKVQAIVDDLEQSVAQLAELDVILAKARYSIAYDGHAVEVAKSGPIQLSQARHPILVEQLEEVVPNDIAMEDSRTVVLSGPNTGGKTVFLKTLGLCALMLRAGMHLPCGPDGRLPVFKRVFAVIGDEQSIEKNLSSFSSHLLNLKDIMQALVPNSLVLIDEIGEGTDPNQGVALAKSILEHLHEHGARTVVTTHFAELMAMAQTREGFANAAMAFDTETMTPTFQLVPGTPGRSSAFAIAERLGLPKDIVERARRFASGGATELDTVVQRLEEQHSRLAGELRKAEAARLQADAEREKQSRILAELREKKARLTEQEREKIREEIKIARVAIKKIIRELQETPSFKAAEAAREKLAEVEKQADEILPPPADSPPPAYLEPIEDWYALPDDARVFVRSLNESAQVLEKPDSKGMVRLQVREKRMTLPARDCYLRYEPPAEKPAKTPVQVITLASPSESADDRPGEELEIDLRGQTSDEALMATDAFLDQALRQRLAQVTVIHGHGTGVLKRTIRDYLKSCPYAKSWRPGKRGEGGDGVTVVELDL
ncbi:MAG: endonuclease MutS2, partial [Alphaproteobacteria bacterium]